MTTRGSASSIPVTQPTGPPAATAVQNSYDAVFEHRSDATSQIWYAEGTFPRSTQQSRGVRAVRLRFKETAQSTFGTRSRIATDLAFLGLPVRLCVRGPNQTSGGDRKVFLVIGAILGGGSALSLVTVAWRSMETGLPFAILFGSFLAFSSVFLGVWGLVKYWRPGNTLERIQVERDELWGRPPDDV